MIFKKDFYFFLVRKYSILGLGKGQVWLGLGLEFLVRVRHGLKNG